MSKLKDIKSPEKKESGSLLFTIIAGFMVIGVVAIIYFALFSPAPKLSIADLERNGQTKGSASAKVSIVEFSDFQCPACGAFYPTEKKLLAEFGDVVRFTYRHFPLPQHPFAQKAAEASECAAEQGKFWEMHDKMFENQENLTIDDLKSYASQLGLDTAKFNSCLVGGKYATEVALDQSFGNSIGINATPTVFINGEKQDDTSYVALKSAIQNAS